MTTHFQQQASDRNLNFSQSAPSPQHGQKADKELVKRAQPPRKVNPKQGPH